MHCTEHLPVFFGDVNSAQSPDASEHTAQSPWIMVTLPGAAVHTAHPPGADVHTGKPPSDNVYTVYCQYSGNGV